MDELGPAFSGHHDVGKDDVDGVEFGLSDLKGFGSVTGGQYAVP